MRCAGCHPVRPELQEIYNRLFAAFGAQHWWPADSPLEVIIGAVLTQNTAWVNVEKAIANLKQHRLINLKRLSRLPPAKLARLIRAAGFYNLKAKRLHSVVKQLEARDGVSGLKRLRTTRLRAELLTWSGIGPETADSILLYALGRPVFVIDAYTRRILLRHGLLTDRETYDEIQQLFQANLPRKARLYNEYHALLVRLAKTFCRTRPLCTGCPLKEWVPGFQSSRVPGLDPLNP